MELISNLWKKIGIYRKIVTRPPLTPVSRFFYASTKYPKVTFIIVAPGTTKTGQGLGHVLSLVRVKIGMIAWY